MWTAWAPVDERSSNRCRGVSILTYSQTYRAFVKCQDCLNSMRRCSYSCTYKRRPTLLMGWRWLWSTRPPRHLVYAQGRRWLSVLAQTKNDIGSQKPRREGSFMRQSSHCSSDEIGPPLLLGCRTMWTTWSS